MTLKPDVVHYLANVRALGAFPSAALTDPAVSADVLTRFRALAPAQTDLQLAAIEDRTTPAGVPVRIYRPHATGTRPTILFVHGGGWAMGSVEGAEAYCRRLCADSGSVVVSVEYSLAPEHPYPMPLDDVEDAAGWVRERVGELGGDPSRLVAMGPSAGGNLVAALTMRDRRAGRAAFALQVLLYPVTDCGMDTASHVANARGHGLEHDQMRWFWQQYEPVEERRSEPELSPLRATDLGSLPPALVITAEHDPLRDEGAAYADRLSKDGVDARHIDYAGQIHGFAALIGVVEDADLAMTDVCEHVEAALNAGRAPSMKTTSMELT